MERQRKREESQSMREMDRKRMEERYEAMEKKYLSSKT